MASIDWEQIPSNAPQYLFTRQEFDQDSEFSRGPSLPEIFSQNGKPAPGFITLHDDFALGFTPEEVRTNVRLLLETQTEEEARLRIKLCSQSQWNYLRAKEHLAASRWENKIIKCLYRPFDYRYTIFDPFVLVHRRQRVSQFLLDSSNIALISTRMTKGEEYRHSFVSNHPTEVILLSSSTSVNAFIFPLYNSVSTSQ